MTSPLIAIAYQGATAPEALSYRVKQARTEVDVSQATAASFLVCSPSGIESTWSPITLTSPVAPANGAGSSVVASYTYGSVANDLAEVGDWVIVVVLTVPGGVVRSEPVLLRVKRKFARPAC